MGAAVGDLVSCRRVLSLPWTGLLVCRGVEGPDNSDEALPGASRGDRGSVLCPLGPSLQDTGSSDSADAKGPAEARCPGNGYLFPPSSVGIS